jgi:uridine kinase
VSSPGPQSYPTGHGTVAILLRVDQARGALSGARTATGTVLVAIDGRAGSGKTTLAEQVAAADPDIRILHADELQRPQAEGEWDAWTPQESSTNFVNEVALNEVLSALAAGQAAEYRPYNWSAHELCPVNTVTPGGVIVVEGAYTLRPSLRRYYTLKFWVECADEVRAARLRARTAPSPGWLDAWLAGEDFYVAHARPEAAADLVIWGDEW